MGDKRLSYILHYHGRCRDCADTLYYVCPLNGLPCNHEERTQVVNSVLRALDYGNEHGFIANWKSP